MRLFHLTFLAGILFIAVPAPAGAQVQPPHLSCEKAEHTADVLMCLNRQHDDAQTHLNDLFLKIVDAQEKQGEDPGLLRDIQKGWLTYRDQECARQVDTVDTESLKRVKELECLLALTQQRSDILTLSFDMPAAGPEHNENVLPLWMNVAARERPDVFWDYAGRRNADLNCDGQDEYVMAGLAHSNPPDVLQIIIAVADAPVTGKPRVDFLSLDHGALIPPASQTETICPVHAVMTTAGHPEKPEDETKPKQCKYAMQVSFEPCPDRHLYWDGENYRLYNTSQPAPDQASDRME